MFVARRVAHDSYFFFCPRGGPRDTHIRMCKHVRFAPLPATPPATKRRAPVALPCVSPATTVPAGMESFEVLFPSTIALRAARRGVASAELFRVTVAAHARCADALARCRGRATVLGDFRGTVERVEWDAARRCYMVTALHDGAERAAPLTPARAAQLFATTR